MDGRAGTGGVYLGRASRRKRERRLGLFPQPPHFELLKHPLPGNLPRREKISACLIELIRPYLPEEASIHAWQAGIAMAATAWNLTALPGSVRDGEIERLLQQEAEALEDPLFMEDLLQLLITRKLQLYPDDPRMVLSWDVRKAGSRVHVTAVSTLPSPPEDIPGDPRPDLAAAES